MEQYRQVDNGELRVGVMGVGNMGAAAVSLLLAAGYPVSTWTRLAREVPGAARCFHGREQLREFAEQADVVINLVPLTEETRWVDEGNLGVSVDLVVRGVGGLHVGSSGCDVGSGLCAHCRNIFWNRSRGPSARLLVPAHLTV